MENLARYIIRASFSQERMTYLDQEGTVVYAAKACPGRRSGNGKSVKVFPALEWLAAMCSHIPNQGEQMVRYYGYYSNVSRGKRQMAGKNDDGPCILDAQEDSKAFRKSWARLIQKIYEVDPLICPKCRGIMRIISFIEDKQVIRAILRTPGIMACQIQAATYSGLSKASSYQQLKGREGFHLDGTLRITTIQVRKDNLPLLQGPGGGVHGDIATAAQGHADVQLRIQKENVLIAILPQDHLQIVADRLPEER